MFAVGQKVVCVDDRRLVLIRYTQGWFARFRSMLRVDHNLNRGHVYVVTARHVLTTVCGKQFEMICVDKARCFERPELGFPSFQFRPLIERKATTDISALKKLLTPSRVDA